MTTQSRAKTNRTLPHSLVSLGPMGELASKSYFVNLYPKLLYPLHYLFVNRVKRLNDNLDLHFWSSPPPKAKLQLQDTSFSPQQHLSLGSLQVKVSFVTSTTLLTVSAPPPSHFYMG
jgi:hypothetical protein